MTRGDWLGLLAGCIVGTVVGVMASGVSFAAPNYAGMPQTRGRGGGGLAAGSPVVAPSGTFGSIDAGFITINAPTGAECVLGIKAVDAFRSICLDRVAGLSATAPYIGYNSGTTVTTISPGGGGLTVSGNFRTSGGSGVGDATITGDFYAGASQRFSVSTATGAVTTDGRIRTTSTLSNGTITLAAGTGTATTFSGANCVCSDTTAANAVRCSVSSTTLTAVGTGTDVIAYHCL